MLWKLVLDLVLLFHRPNCRPHLLYRSFAMNLSHVLAGTCYFFSVFAVWQNSPSTLLSLPQLRNFYLVLTFDTWCFPLVLSTWSLPLVLSTWFLPLVLVLGVCPWYLVVSAACRSIWSEVPANHLLTLSMRSSSSARSKEGGISAKVKVTEKKEKGKEDVHSD